MARFYDPQIAHFVQPDSIIPAAGSSKGYDRYGYVNNNPVKLSDPSGNSPTGPCGAHGEDCQNNPVPIVTPVPPVPTTPIDDEGTSAGKSRSGRNHETQGEGTYPLGADPTSPRVTIGTSPNEACNENNLVWCFYNRGLLPTGTYHITQEQLNELMLAVYYDINNRPYIGYLDRARYDTPFWDYGGVGANSTICVEENCYKGVEVNYFAQGIYSAKYETYDLGLVLVDFWKESQYHQNPSDNTIYWYTVGYDYWMNRTFQIKIDYLK